jgi:hypothetical protein
MRKFALVDAGGRFRAVLPTVGKTILPAIGRTRRAVRGGIVALVAVACRPARHGDALHVAMALCIAIHVDNAAPHARRAALLDADRCSSANQ